MTRSILAAALFALAASTAAAQTRVDHRDPAYPAGFFDTLAPGTPVAGRPGLVWMHDGQGWIQVAATPAPVPVPPPAQPASGFVPSEEMCKDLSPYADGDPAKVLACLAWDRARRPRPPLPVFDVGAVYVHPYGSIRMIVLAVSLGLDGIPVVTAQFTSGGDFVGNVFAFKVNEGQPWTRLQP
jgi:hypothetical protein